MPSKSKAVSIKLDDDTINSCEDGCQVEEKIGFDGKEPHRPWRSQRLSLGSLARAYGVDGHACLSPKSKPVTIKDDETVMSSEDGCQVELKSASVGMPKHRSWKSKRLSIKSAARVCNAEGDWKSKRMSLQSLARVYDVDGDGYVDEAGLAMMKRDKEGRGHLTNEEVYEIVQEQLGAKRDINQLKKAIVGLVCFTFILALSNLGTSFASAILAKDTTADIESSSLRMVSTGAVIGTQSSGTTIELLQLSDEERKERRELVVKELLDDPHGSHAHRRLAKKNKNKKRSCSKNALCEEKIVFDSGAIAQPIVEVIVLECEAGRTINVKRDWEDGTIDKDSLCRAGSEIIIKHKKKKVVQLPNENDAARDAKEITITTDDKSTHFDCNGKQCYVSGSNLLSRIGGPCTLKNGSDDCEEDLVCHSDDPYALTGSCVHYGELPWYVEWDNYNCVQDCEVDPLKPNCGGKRQPHNEIFDTAARCCETHLGWLSMAKCIIDLSSVP